MIFQGTFVGPMSGKLNGVVASHNRGGQYFRTHVIPTDPATTRQLACRDAMAQAYGQWLDNSVQVRQDWQNFAGQVLRTNRIGQPRHNTGFQEFCRWAVPRYQINAQLGYSLGIGNAVARLPEAALITPPVGTIESGGTVFRLSFDNTDFWVHDQDNILFVQLCATRTGPGTVAIRARPSTINYFRSPYQLAGAISGDPDDPIAANIDITVPLTVLVGERMFWRARLSTDDSGMSRPYEGVAIRSA